MRTTPAAVRVRIASGDGFDADGLTVEVWPRDWPAGFLPVDVPLRALRGLPGEVVRTLDRTLIGIWRTDSTGQFEMGHSDLGEQGGGRPAEGESPGWSTGQAIPTPGQPVVLRVFDGLRYVGSEQAVVEVDDAGRPVVDARFVTGRKLATAAIAGSGALASAVVLAAFVLRGGPLVSFGGDEDEEGPDGAQARTGLPPPEKLDEPDDPDWPTDLRSPVGDGRARFPGQSAAFLYTGDDPVQTGVEPGTIDQSRAAVLRGRVIDRTDDPLPGVTIAVQDAPRYGSTTTRASGGFDMVVNGGHQVTLVYALDGFLPAQRTVAVPVRDFVTIDAVALVPETGPPTTVRSDETRAQVVTAGESVDEDGRRRPALVVPPETSAATSGSGGGVQVREEVRVRATEYTVGETGPAAMPGLLPPGTGYTYAIEFTGETAAEDAGIGARTARAFAHGAASIPPGGGGGTPGERGGTSGEGDGGGTAPASISGGDSSGETVHASDGPTAGRFVSEGRIESEGQTDKRVTEAGWSTSAAQADGGNGLPRPFVDRVAPGAVEFSQPLIHYVENFLGFPVGGTVPTGFLDRGTTGWTAAEDGRVVRVLEIAKGQAILDVAGNGQPVGEAGRRSLGITEEELATVAELYDQGQELWRVPVPHFTPWDCNWPFGPPDGADPPPDCPPTVGGPSSAGGGTGGQDGGDGPPAGDEDSGSPVDDSDDDGDDS